MQLGMVSSKMLKAIIAIVVLLVIVNYQVQRINVQQPPNILLIVADDLGMYRALELLLGAQTKPASPSGGV